MNQNKQTYHTLTKRNSETVTTHLTSIEISSIAATVPPATTGAQSFACSPNDADTPRDADTDALRTWPPRSTIPPIRSQTPSSSNMPQSKPMPNALIKFIDKYKIQDKIAKQLLALEDYEIVIVIDDSGSMKTPVDDTQRTRWDELRDIVTIILEIVIIFHPNGANIYFINNEKYHRVKTPTDIDGAFKRSPSGYTPLVRTLQHVFQLPAARLGHEKHLLVFVATDGAPTDDDGNEIVPELEQLMQGGRQVETTYVSFLLCTDEPKYVEYMNKWDQTMKNVDVTDDFKTEKETIQKYRGEDYPFSFGDYVVKALVGAIRHKIDIVNESIQ